jgi:hypothetical protein
MCSCGRNLASVKMERLLKIRVFLLFFSFLLLPVLTGAETHPVPPAYGPYINLRASDFAQAVSFSSTQRLVGTYYFYWYDAESKTHVVDGDGTDAMTTHPANMEGLSWKSVAWHKRQLQDMIVAGIDVVLPVFWGAPSEQNPKSEFHWSYEGLPALVHAREELIAEDKHPPRIGLFYDTSTLQNNRWGEHQDLTTQRGREWFYATVRDFFSMIPPKHWAMIDSRPIVLLYSAAFARKHDQSVVDYLRAEFPKEFGGKVPWLAPEVSWNVKADSVVAWGGALGLKNPGGVASLGPGYDHSAVPGRTPLIVDRRNGEFYREQWLKFLRQPTHFVMVETWDEWHEGTDVAESRESGRRYIELTRMYANLFKQGWSPSWPKGPYITASSVSISLDVINTNAGIRQIDNDDGLTRPIILGGQRGRATVHPPGKPHYMYFAVDDSFKSNGAAAYNLEIEYFDSAPGLLAVEFDGSDLNAPLRGAYTRAAKSIPLRGTKRWHKAEVLLQGARFLNGQNRGADFRLVVEAPLFAAKSLRLERQP